MKRYLLLSVCLLALANISYGQRSLSSLSKLSTLTYKYWKQLPEAITKDYRSYFAFSTYVAYNQLSHYNQGKIALSDSIATPYPILNDSTLTKIVANLKKKYEKTDKK